MKRLFIINFKNYPEVSGKRSVELAKIAEKVARKLGIDIVVCPPHPMIAAVSWEVGIEVFSQSLDARLPGQSTGYVVAEIVRDAGATGTLLNHSEHSLKRREVEDSSKRAREAGLKVCLCIPGSSKVKYAMATRPEFVAIEPPELIGTGISVSRSKPAVLVNCAKKLREGGYNGRILCGAGITYGEDVKRAVELGMEGILVSSAVVKARRWEEKIEELGKQLL